MSRLKFVVPMAILAVALAMGAAPAAAVDDPGSSAEPSQSATAGNDPAAESEPTPEPTLEPLPEPTSDTAPVTGDPLDAAPAVTAPAKPVARNTRLPLREGAVGSRVRTVQQRLQWLGYEIYPGNLDNERMGKSTQGAVKRFQAKFGFAPTGVVGPHTWDLLRRTSGRVDALPKGCRGETTICIDKTQRLVRLVNTDRVVLTLDARFGFVGAETREGTFRVSRKSRDHVSSVYHTAMPFALFFSGGQAVHYSQYFARDGYRGASHGCVNLRDWDRAKWLFDRVSVGTRVHVYRS